MELAPENLSSVWTFFYKFCFPTIWIGGFGFGTVTMWLPPAQYGGPPLPVRFLFLGALIVVSTILYFTCFRLKKVRMDSHYLYISDYFKEIQVPLTQVENVTESRWDNSHPVKIHFSRPTEFGSSITFMPKIRLFGLWSSHPVVEKILQAAGPRSINPGN